MAIVVAILAILAVVGLYILGMAQRLDRLHTRVDVAAAALDAQLRRRDAAVLQLARRIGLRKAATRLATAAATAAKVEGLGRDREVAENAVSRALSGLLVAVVPGDPAAAALANVVTELHDEALRASFARRFYNDTVRDALVIRDRRLVRWLGLAGHARLPAYFEMHDEELSWAGIPVAPRRTIDA